MNEQQDFVVKLEKFEGPLDLLQQLIEKRKLQINTISLAKITGDYIRHIQESKGITVEETGEFVHIASLLILIKSKSLLPVLEYTNEEKKDTLALEERIKLFGFVKKKIELVMTHWVLESPCFASLHIKKEIHFSPDSSCTKKSMHQIALSVIRGAEFFKGLPEKKVRKQVSIEKVIERVLNVVQERVTVSFRKLATEGEKGSQIISFLAVLELIRKDLLSARQKGDFDDILLMRR